MCSQGDFPPYDPPEPRPPRRIVTAGDPLPRGSVALAVLGTLLDAAEYELADTDAMRFPLLWDIRIAKVDTLREARDAVAEAGG